jgi:hypothetical protein
LHNAKILAETRGHKYSHPYKAIRGAEQVHYEKAKADGIAADQIDPIRANNPKKDHYLNEARNQRLLPCQRN